MYIALRKAVIRMLTPWSWRVPDRLAESLNRFSQIEADSAWQMLQALESVEDPTFKGKLFTNALEEVHHAAIFAELARDFAKFPLPLDSKRREQAFDPSGGLVKFEAFHYVGEFDVYNQFLTYAHAAPSPRVREAFLAIRGDEDEHQKLAYKELVRLTQSPQAARRLLRSVRFSRFRAACKRFSKALGDGISSLILSLLYLLVAPIVSFLCRRRLDQSGWEVHRTPEATVTAIAGHPSEELSLQLAEVGPGGR